MEDTAKKNEEMIR